MSYSTASLRRVSELLASRRSAAEAQAEARRAEVHAKNSAIAAIDRDLSASGFAVFGIALSGDRVAERIAAEKEKNLALQEKRREALAAMGLPGDYTQVHYTCAECGDTGYTDRGMCACMKRELIADGFRSSGLGRLIETQSFDNFSLRFYEDEALECARRALDAAKRFAEDFDTTHANLLFLGGTGLGKTHLSTAIARRAIERGFDVVYRTAQDVIADFQYDRFKNGYGQDEDDTERSEKYFDADLLIIDDLGTEIGNQFTVSSLYNIVNSRINAGRSTIINTNLGEKGLLERYDERITSRLFGEFYPYLFRGTDIRRQKL